MSVTPYRPYFIFANGSESGVAGGGLTRYRQPVFTGYADPGAILTMFDVVNGTRTVIDMLTVGDDGHWYSSPSTDLAEGRHEIIANATLPDGQVSGDAGLVFTIDSQAPASPTFTVSGLPASQITNQATHTLQGAAEPLSTIDIYTGGNEDAISIGSTTADTHGQWTTKVTFAEGVQTVSVTATDAAGNASAAAATALTVDTIAPAPPTFALNDPTSLVAGAILTTALSILHLAGMAEPYSEVRFGVSAGGNEVVSGTATTDQDGNWIGQLQSLPVGTYQVTAQAIDQAGNSSVLSLSFQFQLVAPVAPVTAYAVTIQSEASIGGQQLAGKADIRGVVSVWESDQLIAQVQADQTGMWTYDASSLPAGAHFLTARATGLGGDQSISAAVQINVPPPRFDIINHNSGQTITAIGTDYTGPVSYLQTEFGYRGPDNVVIGARQASVFLYGGTGDDALAVRAGSNVLDGGPGSNFLVGSTGWDGGADTFFVDVKGSQFTWDTIVNFHKSDYLTIWNFDPASNAVSWSDEQGALGYKGLTLSVNDIMNGGESARITLAGLTQSTAHLDLSTGTIGGRLYLLIHNSKVD